jgi:hypothetical protein
MDTLSLDELDVAASAWRAEISARHSRRKYAEREVAPDLLDVLEKCVTALAPVSAGVRPVVVRRLRSDIFRGVVGSYGKVTGASSALVLVGEKVGQGIDERIGYVGEALLLEATRLGLSTCWVGGFFSPKRTAEQVALAEGERVYAVSPIGWTAAAPSAGERVMKAIARSHSRRSLEAIAPGLDVAAWPGWAVEGLRAARLAPSAMNRQPWRFRLDGETVRASVTAGPDTPKVSKWLDCGIAMLHFELGARGAGFPGTWELSDTDREACFFRPAATLAVASHV